MFPSRGRLHCSNGGGGSSGSNSVSGGGEEETKTHGGQQKHTPFARFSFAFNNEKFSDHLLIVVPPKPNPSTIFSSPDSLLEAEPCTHHLNNNPSPKNRYPNNNSEVVEEEQEEHSEETLLHVSTLLLASQSEFFASLFSNGMRESKECKTRIVVEEEEKEAFIDVVRFLYEGKFSNEAPAHLLYCLRIADKYAVECAIEESARLLKDLKDSSVETCCMFLDLPDSLQHSDSFAPLLQAAREQLAERFKDLDQMWQTDDLDELSARGIAAVLSSDHLQVQTENTVFQALVKWVSKAPEERRPYLDDLLPLVRLQHMSVNFLRDVVRNSSLCKEVTGFEDALFEAMTYHALDPILKKLESPNIPPPRSLLATGSSSSTVGIAEGTFSSCVDNISGLRKKGNRLSKKYYLGGYFFYMNTKVNNDNMSLFLMVDEASTGLPRQYCIPVQYVFSIKNHETGNYDRKSSYQVIYRGGLSSSWGLANFLNLVDEKNQVYLKHDTLYLRAEIKVHSSISSSASSSSVSSASSATTVVTSQRQWYFRDAKDGVIKLMN